MIGAGSVLAKSVPAYSLVAGNPAIAIGKNMTDYKLRVALITCCISPHQMPFAYCMVRKLGVSNFRYVSTGGLTEERKKLGWSDDKVPDWVLQPLLNQEQRKNSEEWIYGADIVLCGDRDLELFEKRIREKKLTLYMSERWFKPPLGLLRMLHPAYFKMCLSIVRLLKSPYFYYLPMGVYAAEDMRRIYSAFNLFRTESSIGFLLWGYFVGLSNPVSHIKNEGLGKIKILWFGRFLKCKKVDVLLRAIASFNDSIRKKIHLKIIGIGAEEQSLRLLSKQLKLTDVVNFYPPVAISQVRAEIKKADLCVVTSNAQEGWGVAVNEIMLEGRCVVCSDAVGAGATLIKDGVNGLLFHSGSSQDLAEKLQSVLADSDYRNRLATEGRKACADGWLPQVACDRLINASRYLIVGKKIPLWSSGPLSSC